MPRKKSQSTQSTLAGRVAVSEALERQDLSMEKILIARNSGGVALRDIGKLARSRDIPVQYVPDNRLSSISGGANHQGVVAILSPIGYHNVDDMLTKVAPDRDAVADRKPLIVVLDRIEDPYNYGAILRSVVGCGASGVIVPDKNMAPVNAHVIKASAGTAMRIPIARVSNLETTVQMLKERGYWIVGASGDGETPVAEMDWDRPVALLIGNEHSGISSSLIANCDFLVSIPLRGDVESLNASVAAGILLYSASGGLSKV